MTFTDPSVSRYAERFTTPGPSHLHDIDRKTQAEVMRPRMLSGHLQGRLLSLLSKILCPMRVLEIGTYTGYSALCFAEGLAPGGKVTTIENNDELEERIRDSISRAGFSDRIDLIIGDAAVCLPSLPGPFDLVFIDADKENYSTYFDLVIDKVRTGGLILADNVLWSGKVTGPEEGMDGETLALLRFNEKVVADSRVEGVLLPIRDGIFVIRKK
jgi:predicted O-methyltransferase YrrM